jgi:hypothetical protein
MRSTGAVQGVLHADVERFFADLPAGAVTTCKTTDGDHGRIEEKTHCVCHDGEWLFSDRRFAGEPAFPSALGARRRPPR